MTQLSYLKCPVCGWESKTNILAGHTPDLERCLCPDCHILKKGEDGFGYQQRLIIILKEVRI